METFDIDAFLLEANRAFSLADSTEAKKDVIASILAEIPNHTVEKGTAQVSLTPWARLMTISAYFMNNLKMYKETVFLLQQHVQPYEWEKEEGILARVLSVQAYYLKALNGEKQSLEVVDHTEKLFGADAIYRAKGDYSVVTQYNKALKDLGFPHIVTRNLRPLVQKDGAAVLYEPCQTLFRVALEQEAEMYFRAGHKQKGRACLNEILEHGLPLIEAGGPFAELYNSVLPIIKLAQKLGRHRSVIRILRPKLQVNGCFFKYAPLQHMFVDSLYQTGGKAEIVAHLKPLVQRDGAYSASVFAHDYYTNALIDLERCEAAANHLRPLVQPKGILAANPVMHVRFVKALLISKQSAEAVAHMTPLVQPGSRLYHRHPIHYMYAKALIAHGEPDKAVKHLAPFMTKGGMFDGKEYCVRIMVEALKAAGREDEVKRFVRGQEKRRPDLLGNAYHLETRRDYIDAGLASPVKVMRCQLTHCAVA